jgi:hypothetical protein
MVSLDSEGPCTFAEASSTVQTLAGRDGLQRLEGFSINTAAALLQRSSAARRRGRSPVRLGAVVGQLLYLRLCEARKMWPA